MRAIRVLLVDDNAAFRQMLERLLARFGFQVSGSSGDGASALAGLNDSNPDIAIIDMAMPGLNGLELAAQLQTRLPNVGIVILTMHSTPEHRQAAAAAGIDAFVSKGDLLPSLQNALRWLARGGRASATMPMAGSSGSVDPI